MGCSLKLIRQESKERKLREDKTNSEELPKPTQLNLEERNETICHISYSYADLIPLNHTLSKINFNLLLSIY